MTFIRWRGGKINLIPQLNELFPDMYSMNGYIEPFIGGGSIFFFLMKKYEGALKEKPIYLSDINPELINCYRVVRDKVNELISLLEKRQKLNNEKYFYSIRDIYPPGRGLDDIEKASMFIYLCNTCFGGEWRVNSEGRFNKAYGGQDNARIFDKEELLECSKLLKGVKLNIMSFENIVKIKNINNFFVYCCLPGTKIRMRDERLLNIEQIKIGDISFMGGNVVNTMNRNYIGDMYEFESYEFESMGIYYNLCVTEEHPIAIIRQEYVYDFKDNKISKFKNQQILDLLNIQFVMAKNINVGDFLLVPCYPDYHDFGNSQTRSKRRIIIKGDKKFILTPITNILKREYNGPVYNLTTENNVYVANYILNHNCDPPYFDIGNRNFTQYSQDGFHISKRMLIVPTFQKLDELGCKIMMSNSFKMTSHASSSNISEVSPIEQMFKNYNVIRLQTKRMRGVALDKVTKDKIENAERLEEAVILNYKPIKKQKTIDEAWG